MSRLRYLLRRLGPAGITGLAILLLCVPFYFSVLRPAAQQVVAERDAAERQRTRGPFRPASADRRVDDLRRFQGLFPPVENVTNELERLYALARDAKLDLAQGEYRLEKPVAGLVAYRVSLPVRGTYGQLRAFLAALLQEMPIASIDGLRFERRKIAETQLEAQVRLTIHFRPTENAGTR